MTTKVNVNDKFKLFTEQWTPKVVGQVNDQHVKIARIQGDFVWHKHDNEDEMFMVIDGEIDIEFRDKTVHLTVGEFMVVPKGVEHRPRAQKEAKIMLIEPVTTLNTGDQVTEQTQEVLETL
ncbi:MAG: cupin domain-containing protein [Planctomycetota bacterium]|nr:cupin domain-containing protein [Planctomycetota bacterium]